MDRGTRKKCSLRKPLQRISTRVMSIKWKNKQKRCQKSSGERLSDPLTWVMREKAGILHVYMKMRTDIS